MVHTVDASQVVPAAAALVSEKKDSYIAAVKARQEELRNRHENKPVRDLLPLKEARELRWKGAEGGYLPPVPARLGPVSIGSLHGSVSCGCCSDDPRYYVTVQELIGHIDWTPFFHAWELHGSWNRASQEFRTKDPFQGGGGRGPVPGRTRPAGPGREGEPLPGPRRHRHFPGQFHGQP